MQNPEPSAETQHRVAWGPTYKYELRVLRFLCKYTPHQINSDHFTLLSVCSYTLFIISMIEIRHVHVCALLSIVFLVTQWLGDSMDGTIARYRHKERLRYGTLLDHSIDMFFLPLIVLSYSVAGILSYAVTVPFALIVLWAGSYMEQMGHITNRRRMSQASVGYTEFRIMLACLNLSWYFFPSARILTISMYDVIFVTLDIVGAVFLAYLFTHDCLDLKHQDEEALKR